MPLGHILSFLGSEGVQIEITTTCPLGHSLSVFMGGE